MAGKAVYAAAFVILAVLIILGLVLSGSLSGRINFSGIGSSAIQLTDPALVPSGTQALTIAYSDLQVHLSNAGNQSGWISANGNGTVDLTKIINLSQTIGTINLPQNSSVNLIRFNVNSATIRVNGNTYYVKLPSNTITVRVNGGQRVNRSSAVLLDFSPAIATVVSDNSTTYVMIPTVRAIITPNASNATTRSIGVRVKLGNKNHVELEYYAPDITITGESIAVSGNTTHISVTVKDSSNSSVTLRQVAVLGNISVHVDSTHIQSTLDVLVANLSENYCQLRNSGSGQVINISALGPIASIYSNYSAKINSSICTENGARDYTSELNRKILNFSSTVQTRMSESRTLVLFVGSNGALGFPSSEEQLNGQGLTIQPGQSATLQFDGVLSTYRDIITISLVSGGTYRIGVIGTSGDTGIGLEGNVTAS